MILMLLLSVLLLLCVQETSACSTDQECDDKNENVTMICIPEIGCRMQPLHLDDDCFTDAHCKPLADPNSMCRNNTCQCLPKFTRSDMGHCVDVGAPFSTTFIALCVVIPIVLVIGIGFIVAYTRSCRSTVKEPEAVVVCPASAPVIRRSSKAVRVAPPVVPPAAPLNPGEQAVRYSTSQGVEIRE